MSTEIIRQVAASADDGMITVVAGGFGATNIYATMGKYTDSYRIFARFLNLTIPQGATIDSAILSMRAYSSQSGVPVPTKIYFNDIDDAVAPTTAAEYNALALTAAYVDWSPVAQTLNTWYDSPDIKTVIQEVVDRAGWASGNDMQLLWYDNGAASYTMRQIQTYDNAAGNGPILTINYTVPAAGQFMTLNKGRW